MSIFVYSMSSNKKSAVKKHLDKLKKSKSSKLSVEATLKSITEGNTKELSKSITLLESKIKSDNDFANNLIEKALPYSGKSIRIGITGVPGVGKSTFIESFGSYLAKQDKKVAVLAIDPSSTKNKGSILGDKTRMEELAGNKNVFIRPSPSSGSLGGVAQKTREACILCESAGYEIILIETVGVGQSETAVYSMTDFFLLLMLSGAGDELQGIKRGIMEMADAVVITKADGENEVNAKKAVAQYKNALHLMAPKESSWITQVTTCSSIKNKNIDNVWSIIESYVNKVKINGYFNKNREDQSIYWMHETIENKIKSQFYQNKTVTSEIKKLISDIKENKVSSFTAANQLVNIYNNETK